MGNMNYDNEVEKLLNTLDELIEAHERCVPYMIMAANLSKITYESRKGWQAETLQG